MATLRPSLGIRPFPGDGCVSSSQIVTEGLSAAPLSPGCHGASNQALHTPPHPTPGPCSTGKPESPEKDEQGGVTLPGSERDPTPTAPPTLSSRSPDSSHNGPHPPVLIPPPPPDTSRGACQCSPVYDAVPPLTWTVHLSPQQDPCPSCSWQCPRSTEMRPT